MPDNSVVRQRFHELVDSGETLLVPGAANALTARIIEDVGFSATYLTGAGISNTYLGMPDIGLLTLQELAAHVSAVNNVVDTPLIADADTGFGNAVNTWHTVRVLERAGASAIQIEDQTFPKRCGHFDGKATIAAEEMVEKIHAAVEARSDPHLLVIARTDARYELGLDEACRRARMYREAGAEITFVEAPQTEEEIEQIAKEVEGPKVLNIVQGGKTPALSLDRAQELGFSILLYANLPLLVSLHAVHGALERLRVDGNADGSPDRATWEQRQSYVRKEQFDEMSERYKFD